MLSQYDSETESGTVKERSERAVHESNTPLSREESQGNKKRIAAPRSTCTVPLCHVKAFTPVRTPVLATGRGGEEGARETFRPRLPDWGRNSPVRHPRHASHPPCWCWLRPVAPPPGTDPLPLKELHSVRIHLLVADLYFPQPRSPHTLPPVSYIPLYLSVLRMHDTPVDSLTTRSS
ncbi:hypothetical protein E2C01_003540 [Portunus trituberculatus]|uniref:Uncharacterized protein n=1 Tax=Portunus trituberculatus TaxID=210409 RepID=A0A5B7CNY5_PORTR|nr:hypothetical protein [Portunus trituberculatus]